MKFGRLLTIGALFGGLLFPLTSAAGDIYQAAGNAYGAARFTVDVYGFNNSIATAEDLSGMVMMR